MAKEIMRRRASDSKYLHQDFHGALSAGIDYLDCHYGEEAVRQYLRQFTSSFYSPLIKSLKERGLIALKEHFEKIYEDEGGNLKIVLSEDEMVLKVKACPAVRHMRQQGYPVAKLFYETTKTVNETLCKDTPFSAELLEYDEQTGHSVQRFYRRGR